MLRRTISTLVLAAATATQVSSVASGSQIQAIYPQVRAATGQNVAPVYEGWYRTPEGSVFALFGYFNRNTEEVVDIPIGDGNKIVAGPADRGQPTRFAPGRVIGAFSVPVANDQIGAELVWTLTVHGQTVTVPVNLDPAYAISPLKYATDGNTPPVVKLDPDGPSAQGLSGLTLTRHASRSVPMKLDLWFSDDGLPRPGVLLPRGSPEPSVTWAVYRSGPGSVTISDSTPPLEGGKASTTATFSEPGDYVLHAVASDGSHFGYYCCWTLVYLKVVVSG